MPRKFNDLQWYDGAELDEEGDFASPSTRCSRSSIFDDPLEVFIEFFSEDEIVFIEIDPSGRRVLITVDEETGFELREILPDNFV